MKKSLYLDSLLCNNPTSLLTAFLFAALSITPLRAQTITTEIGGSSFRFPSINFEYLLQDKSKGLNSNGVRVKVGVSYFRYIDAPEQYIGLHFGYRRVWGNRNRLEAGLDFNYLGFDQMFYTSVYPKLMFYPFFGYRFGNGPFQGVTGVGILFIPPSKGDLRFFDYYFPLPMINLGISYNLNFKKHEN